MKEKLKILKELTEYISVELVKERAYLPLKQLEAHLKNLKAFNELSDEKKVYYAKLFDMDSKYFVYLLEVELAIRMENSEKDLNIKLFGRGTEKFSMIRMYLESYPTMSQEEFTSRYKIAQSAISGYTVNPKDLQDELVDMVYCEFNSMPSFNWRYKENLTNYWFSAYFKLKGNNLTKDEILSFSDRVMLLVGKYDYPVEVAKFLDSIDFDTNNATNGKFKPLEEVVEFYEMEGKRYVDNFLRSGFNLSQLKELRGKFPSIPLVWFMRKYNGRNVRDIIHTIEENYKKNVKFCNEINIQVGEIEMLISDAVELEKVSINAFLDKLKSK